MVTHADWFGGFYQERKNFFPKYPVNPREWFAAYPEFRIDPAQLDAFEKTRTGTVVPAELAANTAGMSATRFRSKPISIREGLARVCGIVSSGRVRSASEASTSQTAHSVNYDYHSSFRHVGGSSSALRSVRPRRWRVPSTVFENCRTGAYRDRGRSRAADRIRSGNIGPDGILAPCSLIIPKLSGTRWRRPSASACRNSRF